MTTVALRGTLEPVTSEENANTTLWRWKGIWAFGSTLATATCEQEQEQLSPHSSKKATPPQPFQYNFEFAKPPTNVPVPWVYQEDDDNNNDDATTPKPSAPATNSSGADAALLPESSSKKSTLSTPISSQKDGILSAAHDKDDDKAGDPVSAHESQQKGEPGQDTLNKSDVPKEEEEVQQDDPKVLTFAIVPDGDPPFVEASAHFEKQGKKVCPASGQWTGFFQNATTVGRSRSIALSKVDESFYLCFNANPGKKRSYFFDGATVPESLEGGSRIVFVRGIGENAFGSFELMGYLDVTTNTMELQRQYLLLQPLKKPGSSPRPRSSPSKNKTTTSPSSSASRPTRKRQPSWKKRSEVEEIAEPKRRRGNSIGGRKKSEKSLDELGSASTTTATGTIATPQGATGIPVPAIPGMAVPSAGMTPNTSMEPTFSADGASGIVAVPPGSVTAVTPAAQQGSFNASGISGLQIQSTTLQIDSASKRSSSGTSRKRKSQGKRRKSGSNTGMAGSSTPPGGSSASHHLKLPPAGDAKKSRWRAAHFLYYQRHEPELEVISEKSESGGSNVAGNSGSASGGKPQVPNPRYVVYEGEMVNGLREGRGMCLYNNQMMYEGEWKRNKEHGKGKLMSDTRKRVIYEGDWERGRMQGSGTYYYYGAEANPFSLGGKKRKGCKASKVQGSNPTASGTLGARYVGEFKENMRNGTGTYYLADGSSYSGIWRDGTMNGRGVFFWPDGSVYDGEWKDGKRFGQGLLKASNGFIYDGMWVNNAMEGRGLAIYPNGQQYEGQFSNGRREGRGTVHFPNGAVYEGRFRDDAIDGQGTMKMTRSLVVPREECASQSGKEDFMIPISFQSDMTHIHAKAGFTAIGE